MLKVIDEIRRDALDFEHDLFGELQRVLKRYSATFGRLLTLLEILLEYLDVLIILRHHLFKHLIDSHHGLKVLLHVLFTKALFIKKSRETARTQPDLKNLKIDLGHFFFDVRLLILRKQYHVDAIGLYNRVENIISALKYIFDFIQEWLDYLW